MCVNKSVLGPGLNLRQRSSQDIWPNVLSPQTKQPYTQASRSIQDRHIKSTDGVVPSDEPFWKKNNNYVNINKRNHFLLIHLIVICLEDSEYMNIAQQYLMCIVKVELGSRLIYL